MIKKIIFIFSFFFIFSFSNVLVVSADQLINEKSVCDCNPVIAGCEKACGEYSLNDILEVGVRATQILLTLSGSVALLFFIYGGVTFLISGGSAERVSKGKQIIINAVIGLLIIFTSFIIIKFSMEALGFKQDGVLKSWNQSL
jgi:hypothetical protein